nr:ATP-binding cassette domain-containing protein [Bacteroidota bacterium]
MENNTGRDVIIRVDNLVKKYEDIVAVKGISFEVYRGEIFGLLGPNGAGKTTTLEIMETLRTKTSGEIMINGYSVDKQPNEVKKIIGVQLQAAGYYPNLNLLELMDMFAGLYNTSVDAMKMLALVGLTDKAKAKY